MVASVSIYDICVIGAGSSGLSAAIAAKKESPDASVILLEEKDRIGQKILVTGNGRCNLSNEDISASHYGGDADRYSELIGSAESDREFFEDLSLLTYTDKEGRIYPYSNQASSVLNAFIRKIDSLGVDIICSYKAIHLCKKGSIFTISSEKGENIRAQSVIVAVGSPAGNYKYDVQALIKSAGDDVVPFRPALVPVYVKQDVRQMKGARFKALVRLSEEGNCIAEELGEVQVGDGYLSGICVMNLSRYIDGNRSYELKLDLAPDLSDEEIDRYLTGISGEKVKISEMMSGILPKRVGEEFMRGCCDDIFKRTSDSLTAEEADAIRRIIREWSFSVRSLGPVNMAQISAGGVRGLNAETLGSSVLEGLFYCGEVVNVDGECGGYNLHWAWVSGCQAGKSAAEYLKNV